MVDVLTSHIISISTNTLVGNNRFWFRKCRIELNFRGVTQVWGHNKANYWVHISKNLKQLWIQFIQEKPRSLMVLWSRWFVTLVANNSFWFGNCCITLSRSYPCLRTHEGKLLGAHNRVSWTTIAAFVKSPKGEDTIKQIAGYTRARTPNPYAHHAPRISRRFKMTSLISRRANYKYL